LADELVRISDPAAQDYSTEMFSYLPDICFSALSLTPFEFHDGNPLHDIYLTESCNFVLATFPQTLELILNIQEEDGDEGLEGSHQQQLLTKPSTPKNATIGFKTMRPTSHISQNILCPVK
jgi:hypothetical protein